MTPAQALVLQLRVVAWQQVMRPPAQAQVLLLKTLVLEFVSFLKRRLTSWPQRVQWHCGHGWQMPRPPSRWHLVTTRRKGGAEERDASQQHGGRH